jgi:hypothetical protein
MVETILEICGVFSAMAGTTAIAYKFYRWWQPGTAEILCHVILNRSRPDSISVKVTNRKSSAIYLRSCTVRSTYTLSHLLCRHLKHPLLSPNLYPNLRYNGAIYQFIRGEPVKLEPGQLRELRIDIFEHPLNAIYGPILIAKVVLTSGKGIVSKRIEAPPVWRNIGKRGR